jgi:hypothetical protein
MTSRAKGRRATKKVQAATNVATTKTAPTDITEVLANDWDFSEDTPAPASLAWVEQNHPTKSQQGKHDIAAVRTAMGLDRTPPTESKADFFAMVKRDFDKKVIQTSSGLEKGLTVFKRPKDMDTAVTMADKLGTIRPTPKGAVFVKTTRRALTDAENIAIEREVAACDRIWSWDAKAAAAGK